MMHLVALAMVLWGLWRFCSCGRWFYVGVRPTLADRRDFRRWQAGQRVRRRIAVRAGDAGPNRADGDGSSPSDDEDEMESAPPVEPVERLSWLDQTLCCWCLWPLCWRGRFSPGCLGTMASLACRGARCFCVALTLILMLSAAGGLARLAARDGQSMTDIWNSTVTRKLAERAARTEL